MATRVNPPASASAHTSSSNHHHHNPYDSPPPSQNQFRPGPNSNTRLTAADSGAGGGAITLSPRGNDGASFASQGRTSVNDAGSSASVYSGMIGADAAGGGGGGADDSLSTPACCCGDACYRRWDRCRTAFRRSFCFTFALILSALNLIFFLCLSVLLVMVSADLLITLVIQVALPPSGGYAFGGAALICVIFPWIAVWVSVVADYSRWPSKYFLIHYHLRVSLGVQEPLPILRDPRQTGAGAGAAAFGGGATASGAIYSLYHLHEEKRTDEEIEESRTRSKVQIGICLLPMCIWFISLGIGVTVGATHAEGTVFFLTIGFVLVLFVSCVEYDTAPTSQSLELAWFRWRPSESSSMRYILLNNRRFELSIIGVLSALVTSIIVFVRDSDAIASHETGFSLSIVTLALALIFIFALRWANTLDGKFDARSGYANMSSSNSSAGASPRTSAGAPLLGARHASTQRYGTDVSGDNDALAAAQSNNNNNNNGNGNTAPGAGSAVETGSSLADQVMAANRVATENTMAHADEAAKSHSACNCFCRGDAGCTCCGQRITWRHVRHIVQQHREFVLLSGELITLVAAASALSAQSIADTWPVWLVVLTCATCTIGLWFMNVQSVVLADEEERGLNNSPQSLKQMQTKLALKIAKMDEETQAVYRYHPPKHPPEAVYRVAYFVVGFVATVIVLTSFFDDKEMTRAVCGACPSSSSSSVAATTATTTPPIPSSTGTTQPPWRRRAADDAYPICATVFPGGLNIVDIASLSAASMMRAGSRQDQIATFFPGSNDTGSRNFITEFAPSTRTISGNFLTFDYFSLRMPNRSLSVIATRGAYTAFEALQQMYVLSDAVALQVAIMLVPLPFSDRLLSAMIKMVSLFKFGTSGMTDHLFRAAKTQHELHPDDDVLLVGFSLGGFVSNIVAARHNNERITSVTIAPIGSGYQSKRFLFNVNAGDKLCTSVVSEDDLEARFDMQMGMTAKLGGMQCGLQNSFCHNARAMLNQLSRVCKDQLNRTAEKVV